VRLSAGYTTNTSESEFSVHTGHVLGVDASSCEQRRPFLCVPVAVGLQDDMATLAYLIDWGGGSVPTSPASHSKV